MNRVSFKKNTLRPLFCLVFQISTLALLEIITFMHFSLHTPTLSVLPGSSSLNVMSNFLILLS